MLTDLISVNHTGSLKFTKENALDTPKAQLIISNKSTDNVAYKIKTTQPKFFVVKPIQGIIHPGREMTVDIQLHIAQINSLPEVFKNRFMILATPTDLQVSENFRLQKLWEDKNASRDKSNQQQIILKIDIIEAQNTLKPPVEEGDSRRGTVVNKTDTNIKYSGPTTSTVTNQYEPAPTADINKSFATSGGQSMKPAVGASATMNDQQKLGKLETDIAGLQEEVNKIMKSHGGDQPNAY